MSNTLCVRVRIEGEGYERDYWHKDYKFEGQDEGGTVRAQVGEDISASIRASSNSAQRPTVEAQQESGGTGASSS